MELDVLKDLGLTGGEIRVYLALLELGKSSANAIIRKSGISPSKIYDVLERLLKKGVVSYFISGKVRNYAAVSPERLKVMLVNRKELYFRELDELEKNLNETIPILKLQAK